MKFKANIIWVVILFVVFVIATIITVKYSLYSTMGTLWTIIINFSLYTGVVATLGIDDWLLWYKKWLINKYNNKYGYFRLKIYYKNLNKHYIMLPVTIEDYFITNHRRVVFFTMFKNVWPNMPIEDQKRKLYFTINPFTNRVNICDNLGNKYTPKKLQLYSTKEGLTDMNENIKYFINVISMYVYFGEGECIDNITINKDSINFVRKDIVDPTEAEGINKDVKL